jgi:hypothetical protein
MMKLVECLRDDFMVHKGKIGPNEHPKGDNSQASGSFKGKKMQMKKHASQKEGTLRWQEIER